MIRLNNDALKFRKNDTIIKRLEMTNEKMDSVQDQSLL